MNSMDSIFAIVPDYVELNYVILDLHNLCTGYWIYGFMNTGCNTELCNTGLKILSITFHCMYFHVMRR